MHDGHDHNPAPPVDEYGPYLADGPTPIANYGYMPTTVSVRDGSWFSPAVWSNGVPGPQSIVQVKHAVTIAPTTETGDLNGDGKLDVSDYLLCKTTEDYKRFGDAYFGLAQPSSGAAVAESCLITPAGCLSVHESGTLTIGTVQVLGCFELFGGDLIFRDLPFDYVKDAMQWGHGLIGHSGGKVMTRGGAVYSENLAGVRGHFAILHSCHGDLEGTEFSGLGRTKIGALDNTQLEADGITPKHIGTNQMARYGGPHFHHCWGPPGLPADVPQFRIVDCYIHDGTKWGITIHQSHFGLVAGNRIERCGGAGIAFEDGNEFGNVVKGNRISGIFGDGKGVQGHANGENVRDIGDGTAANPFRTSGSHGNEGAGIWGRCVCNGVIDNEASDCPFGMNFWSRFQPGDSVLIPAAKGERPSLKVLAGGQMGYEFRGNRIKRCDAGMNVQGLIDTFELTDHTIDGSGVALATSYNGTLKCVRLQLRDCGTSYKNGFTERLELIDCTVEQGNHGFDIPADVYVEGGVFDTKQATFAIQYKHVHGGQTSMALRGPRFTGSGNHLSYKLGDLNKNRGYHAPRDLFCYDWNGVEGDNFQVWMPQQAADYVPVNNTPHPVRITPQAGITNAQMLDGFLLCLGGRITPPSAMVRPGITGMVTPILADLEPPKIINLTQAVTPTGITVKFETTKPARFRAEWNLGDILWGKYANLVLPVGKEFKTSHEFTIGGLATGKKYGYIVQVVDENGNLGGDVKVVNSMRYIERFFVTK